MGKPFNDHIYSFKRKTLRVSAENMILGKAI